jgi:hypothetical protein
MHTYMLNKVNVKYVYPFNVFKWGMVKECYEISSDLDIPANVMICRPGAVIFDTSNVSNVATNIWLVKEGASDATNNLKVYQTFRGFVGITKTKRWFRQCVYCQKKEIGSEFQGS